MSKLVGIVGDPGSGKSTSIKSLDPKETYIINVAGKELPFKGSEKLYNPDNKNYREVEDAKDILALLETLSNSDAAKHIKTIVIDDGNYVMGFNLVNKATEVGYTKFSVMAKDMVKLIQSSKKFRDDLVIFYLTHSEAVEDAGEVTTYKMKTAGKMIDNQINMDGLFTVVLYTDVETKGSKAEFSFITNRYKKYPAKSPVGMFEDLKIPNDLSVVLEKVKEYYK